MGVNAAGEALAVATRASKKAVRVLLYTIIPGSAAASSLTATALCFAQAEVPEVLLVKVSIPWSHVETASLFGVGWIK